VDQKPNVCLSRPEPSSTKIIVTEFMSAKNRTGSKIAFYIAILVLIGILSYGAVFRWHELALWALDYFWMAAAINAALFVAFVWRGIFYIKREYPTRPDNITLFLVFACCVIFIFLTVLLLYSRDSIIGFDVPDVIVSIFCLVSVFLLVAIFAIFVLHFEDEE
jgi:4-amino-4-deoxy-L-arabinose transferase-like glycosyltransferase